MISYSVANDDPSFKPNLARMKASPGTPAPPPRLRRPSRRPLARPLAKSRPLRLDGKHGEGSIVPVEREVIRDRFVDRRVFRRRRFGRARLGRGRRRRKGFVRALENCGMELGRYAVKGARPPQSFFQGRCQRAIFVCTLAHCCLIEISVEASLEIF